MRLFFDLGITSKATNSAQVEKMGEIIRYAREGITLEELTIINRGTIPPQKSFWISEERDYLNAALPKFTVNRSHHTCT